MSDSVLGTIIVTHNSAADIEACLDAAIPLLPADAPIVVVDNASGDGTGDILERYKGRVTYLANPTNVGFGRACNQAAAALQTEWLLLINPDVRLVELSVMDIQSLGKQATVGAASARLADAATGAWSASRWAFPPDFLGAFIHSWGCLTPRFGARTQYRLFRRRQGRWASAALLAIKRTAWDAVGGFCPSYFLYYEDMDIGRRLQRSGFETVATSSIRGTHTGGASFHGTPLFERTSWSIAGWLTYVSTWSGPVKAVRCARLLVANLLLAIAFTRLVEVTPGLAHRARSKRQDLGELLSLVQAALKERRANPVRGDVEPTPMHLARVALSPHGTLGSNRD